MSTPHPQGRRKEVIGKGLRWPQKRRARIFLPFARQILEQSMKEGEKKLAFRPPQRHNPVPSGRSAWHHIGGSNQSAMGRRRPFTEGATDPVGRNRLGARTWSEGPLVALSSVLTPRRSRCFCSASPPLIPDNPTVSGLSRRRIRASGLAHPLNHTVGVPNDALGDRRKRWSLGQSGAPARCLKPHRG